MSRPEMTAPAVLTTTSPDGSKVTPAGTPVFVASGHPPVEVLVANAILHRLFQLSADTTCAQNLLSPNTTCASLLAQGSGPSAAAFLGQDGGSDEVIFDSTA